MRLLERFSYGADLRTETASRLPGTDFILKGRRYVVASDRKPIEVTGLSEKDVREVKRWETARGR
jgi:hypothetical protein